MTNNKNNDPQGAGTTLLVLVVDRSGSMEAICQDMEGGIKHLIREQATRTGDCVVTLAQFDTEYELVFEAIPAAEVTGYHLVPRGSTALLDAIGRTIGEVRSSLDKLPAERRPDQVVFAVVTDGLENSSREWTRDKVMAAVKERSDAGWQFSFLGANQDAIKEGGRPRRRRGPGDDVLACRGDGGHVLALRFGEAREDRPGPLSSVSPRRNDVAPEAEPGSSEMGVRLGRITHLATRVDSGAVHAARTVPRRRATTCTSRATCAIVSRVDSERGSSAECWYGCCRPSASEGGKVPQPVFAARVRHREPSSRSGRATLR